MTGATLKVGDTVNWRGGFGLDAPVPAEIADIEVTGGRESGDGVEEVDWSEVYGRNVVVTLRNGHWAYAAQISPAQVCGET